MVQKGFFVQISTEYQQNKKVKFIGFIACFVGFIATLRKIAGIIIPFLELGFWDKNTAICAGAMPLPGSMHLKLKHA